MKPLGSLELVECQLGNRATDLWWFEEGAVLVPGVLGDMVLSQRVQVPPCGVKWALSTSLEGTKGPFGCPCLVKRPLRLQSRPDCNGRQRLRPKPPCDPCKKPALHFKEGRTANLSTIWLNLLTEINPMLNHLNYQNSMDCVESNPFLQPVIVPYFLSSWTLGFLERPCPCGKHTCFCFLDHPLGK